MKTLLFVDDEPNILQGLQRQLRPMRHEWEMHFLAGGQQALDFMGAHPVDIIVSDMMMPQIDGSQLLGEVLKRHPQTVRIILSGQTGSEAILRLVGPAHQYLSKPCDPDELREAISRSLNLRDLLGNERLKRLTTRIKNLPSSPSVQSRLAMELQKPSPSLESIGEIISRDIALTAKILQLVNSAFFGAAQTINNPAEAVLFLGLNTIQALVLSQEMFSRYEPAGCQNFSFEALTNHSWLTGVLARRLANLEEQDLKVLDQCFLAGLLHDVGQLILASGLPADYSEVILRAEQQHLPVWQLEQEVFGATHCEVGAYLLALWGLANPVTEAVAFHHQPARCAGPGFTPGLAVHVADVLAHEFSPIKIGVPPLLDADYLTRQGLAGRMETWRESCRELVEP
jgi:HD-like signal output (HDOD) protein